MKRTGFLGALALGLVSLVGACGGESRTAIVVALSSEAPIPDGVRSIRIEVVRGGKAYHDATYHVLQPKADEPQLTVDDIPGTLTVVDDGEATGPVTVRATADVVTEGDSRKVVRSSTLAFAADKQRLLRMPIQLSCADPEISCKSGETCSSGRCVPEAVDEATVEEFSEDKARPVAGKCFQRTTCLQKGEGDLRIPIEMVVEVLRDDCTVPYVFPNLELGGVVIDKDVVGATTPETSEALRKKRERVNMGYIWSGAYNVQNKGKDEISGSWTVVDRSQSEGWEYADLHPSTRGVPEAGTRVVLSEGLCRALKADRASINAALAEARGKAEALGKLPPGIAPDLEKKIIREHYTRPATRLLGTVESRGCPPKPRDLPECRPGQAGIEF